MPGCARSRRSPGATACTGRVRRALARSDTAPGLPPERCQRQSQVSPELWGLISCAPSGVLSLCSTTDPASPSRTGQDSFGHSIFMIVVDDPRYKRFSYQDHETGLGRSSGEVAAAVDRHLVTR